MYTLEKIGQKAKLASSELLKKGALKNKALSLISKSIIKNKDIIIKANKLDVLSAEQAGLSPSMIDRLTLTNKRIEDMCLGVDKIIEFPDPIGSIISGETRQNGLEIKKVRVPLGVIGIIYESRPNVTADAACLCLKSGNAVILRGGKEAINSNICLSNIMRDAVKESGLPEDCIQLIRDTSRNSAVALMKLREYIDVLIPRGGAGLIKSVIENSNIPVIETGVGNCHIYVDESADFSSAIDIIYNAKTSRPSVCNAVETVLIHESIADAFLPILKEKLDEMNVELRGCEKSVRILKNNISMATQEDFSKEFLDYVLAVKVVFNIEQAIDHILKYSTGHSEAILTKDYNNAMNFTKNINSAAVYVNASTRFTDGSEFGLGAEIGISTQKLHARGPMGVNELTSFKFIINGSGQIR